MYTGPSSGNAKPAPPPPSTAQGPQQQVAALGLSPETGAFWNGSLEASDLWWEAEEQQLASYSRSAPPCWAQPDRDCWGAHLCATYMQPGLCYLVCPRPSFCPICVCCGIR